MSATRDPSPIDALRRLFDAKGTLQYGECVNQIEHALQCATLAERAGDPPEIVIAAFLHDVGHMVHRDAAAALDAGEDDLHETLGAKWLARWFGPEVTEPIAMHVDAKRFLCAREAGYHEGLSPVSQRSLAIQGGPMSDDEAAAFERRGHADGAVRVRRWDDLGKQVDMPTGTIEHFLAVAATLVRAR